MYFMICYLCSSHSSEAGGSPLEKGDIFFATIGDYWHLKQNVVTVVEYSWDKNVSQYNKTNTGVWKGWRLQFEAKLDCILLYLKQIATFMTRKIVFQIDKHHMWQNLSRVKNDLSFPIHCQTSFSGIRSHEIHRKGCGHIDMTDIFLWHHVKGAKVKCRTALFVLAGQINVG